VFGLFGGDPPKRASNIPVSQSNSTRPFTQTLGLMDSDDFWGLAWIFVVLFVFEMMDFDVVAKMFRKRLRPILQNIYATLTGGFS
jgi:hypothetical protein